MSGNDFVTEEQCDKKFGEIYKRINGIDLNVARIFGGVAVVVFVSTFVVTLVAFHLNLRFSGIEKSIEKMDTRLVKYISQQAEKPFEKPFEKPGIMLVKYTHKPAE